MTDDTLRESDLHVRLMEAMRQLGAQDIKIAELEQERDEAERRGMERAAEAVLQTVIKFDVDWLRTATKTEAIAETLRQASAALRGETGG
jgi:alcohol dehydrogenase YqhD (iron-dependent ADH family)